jgi:hypothetical protein
MSIADAGSWSWPNSSLWPAVTQTTVTPPPQGPRAATCCGGGMTTGGEGDSAGVGRGFLPAPSARGCSQSLR